MSGPSSVAFVAKILFISSVGWIGLRTIALADDTRSFFMSSIPEELQLRIFVNCVAQGGEPARRALELTSRELVRIGNDEAVRRARDEYYDRKIAQLSEILKLGKDEIVGNEVAEILESHSAIAKRLRARLNQDILISIIEQLQRKIEESGNGSSPTLALDRNKAYFVAFLYQSMGVIERTRVISREAARDAANSVAKERIEKNPDLNVPGGIRTYDSRSMANQTADEAPWDPASIAVRKAVLRFTTRASLNAVEENFNYPSKSEAVTGIQNEIEKLLMALPLNNSFQIGKAAYALAEVLTLKWMENHFKKSLDRAFYVIPEVSRQTSDINIQERIIRRSILQPEVSRNPLLRELNEFMKNVKESVYVLFPDEDKMELD